MKSSTPRSLLGVCFVTCLMSWSSENASAEAESASASKNEPKIEKESDTRARWPAAEITIGGEFRDAEAEGIGDILVPVWSYSSGLFFVNPRASRTDHSEEEYNLGVGCRQLFPKVPFILGANAYYDYRDTGHSTYNQWGVGLEFLSAWVDARANYYRPEDKETTVGTASDQSVAQSSSTESGWTDPYATDNEIAQSYITERITRTTTTTYFYEQYERAMEGYDGEIGLRLPLPIAPEKIDTRVFGGYYLFDADYGDDVKGFKGRLEIRLLSSLFFDAALYENKDLTGSDYYVGGRFSLPFDLAALANGKNPFAETKSRFKGNPRPFDARLTEMVMRDPHIRTEISPFKEREDLRKIETEKDKDTWRQDYVLMDDVTFVNLDAGSSSGDGTAEHSLNSIQEGVDNAFGLRNVYVYNAESAYRENVELAPGVTLWGSGCLIPGYDGKSFGSGVHPTVDGSSQGPAVTMADRSTLRGFRITNTGGNGSPVLEDLPVLGEMDVSRVGVLSRDATDFTVMCNIIEDAEIGAAFTKSGDFNMSFLNNTVLKNDDLGMVVAGEGNSGSFNLTVDNSLFLNNGLGLCLGVFDYDVALANIRGSQFNGNQCEGVDITMEGNMLADVSILGSRAVNNGDNGFFVALLGSEEAHATLSGLSAHNNGGNGIDVGIYESGLGMLRIDRSRASGNSGFGVGGFVEGVDLGFANLSGLQAKHNGGMGILLQMDAELAALGTIGLPGAMADTLESVAGMAGVSLPSEVKDFMDSHGPVEVSGNGGPGVMAIIEGDMVAGGLFCDITARENLGGGVIANVISEDGFAVGLAGSSKNMMEVVQLGSDVAGLFDYDIPVTPSPDGLMRVNNNLGPGFVMSLQGDFAAIGAMVGMEAYNNLGCGAALTAESEGYSIAAAARMDTHNTLGDGLLLQSEGSAAAVNLVADARSTGNMGNGITSIAGSDDGVAGTLFMSTDPLRSLAAALGEQFLGERIVLPGEPFGPVVASGNGGDGIVAQVDGYDLAFGAFLDTQTSGNGDDGLDASITSDDGSALAAVVSSDLLLEMLPDLLPFIDPIPYTPLGGVIANDNVGSGIRLAVNGQNSAIGYVMGVTANGNRSVDSAGIQADIVSASDDIAGGFMHIRANENAEVGLEANLTASAGDAAAFFRYVETRENGSSGLSIKAPSVGGDLDMEVENIVARNNGDDGLQIEGSSAGDVNILGERIVSVNNAGDGVQLNVTAGGVYALDFGDEFGFSEGQCSIFGNTGFDFNNAGGGTAMAEDNWWGVAPPAAGQFSGLVDYTPWLTSDPNP